VPHPARACRRPDVQYHFAPAYFVDHGAEEFDGHAITLGPVLITPKSRGPADACAPSDPSRSRGSLPTRSPSRGRRRDARGDARSRARLIATEQMRSVVKREI
jgi:hypothetical protein